MRNYNRNYWWLFLLFFIFIGGNFMESILPLVIMIIAVAAIAFAAVNSSKKADEGGRSRRSFRSSSVHLSPDQRARINVFLRRYFQQRPALRVSDSFTLRLHGSRYQSLTSLDVYRDGSYLADFDSFASRYPDTCEQMIGTLLQMARGQEAVRDDVVDVEATAHVDTPAEEKKEPENQPDQNPKQEKNVQYFIDEINRLNQDIPDKEISDSLYETCALLKQIQQLQKKFPDSASKLEKLYAYYLPILLKILNQYDTLQSVTSDPNFGPTKQKLTKTIALINQAMKTIISSMTDQDFINLSADISTLEAVLQKDGLAGDTGMEMPSGEDEDSRKA